MCGITPSEYRTNWPRLMALSSRPYMQTQKVHCGITPINLAGKIRHTDPSLGKLQKVCRILTSAAAAKFVRSTRMTVI